MILEERKKCLIAEQVRSNDQIASSLPEYAISNVWHLVRDDVELCKYLPDYDMNKDRWPDRRFFWGVLSTLRRDWVDEYVKRAQAMRNERLVHSKKGKVLPITRGWREMLGEHDYLTREGGK